MTRNDCTKWHNVSRLTLGGCLSCEVENSLFMMAHSATNKSYTLTMLTNTVCFKRVTLPPFRQEHISYLFISLHISYISFILLHPGPKSTDRERFPKVFVSVLCLVSLVFRPKKRLPWGSSCWTGMARLVNLLLSVAICCYLQN